MRPRSKTQSFKYDLRHTIKPTIAPLTAAVTSALGASSLQAATITVTTLQDGAISGECSLRSALTSATTNSASNSCTAGDVGLDRIEFEPGLNGVINLLPGESSYFDGSTLPIGESVTIDGDNRITVTGSGAAPVFYAKYDPGGLETEEATFERITITGGGGDAGGGIYSRAKTLTLTGTTVTNNSAVSAGGGVWHRHPTPALSRFFLSGSDIRSNQTTGASSFGGGLYVGGQIVDLQFSSTTIADNTALGSGGGLEHRPNTGGLRFYSSEFYGNVAKYGDGGAVNSRAIAPGYGISFFARDSEFRNNSASGNGGGIALSDTNSGVSGFGRFTMRGAVISGNLADEDGGGLWLQRGDGSGTAAEPNNEILLEQNTFNGRRTVISDNEAASAAGGLFISVGDATPVTLDGVDIELNVANDGNGGGALILGGNADLALSRSRLSGNIVAAGGAGGGLLADLDGGDFGADQVQFIDNQAPLGAGGARIDSNQGEIGLERVEFRGNQSGDFGGGLQIYGTPTLFGLGASVITGNSADSSGGGIDLFVPGSTNTLLEIKYSELSDNASGGYGGAVNASAGLDSQLIIENSTLSGNSAVESGGGLFAVNAMELSLKYATVANNTAGTEGGGVFTNLTYGCQISNSLLAGNTTGAEDQDVRAGGGALCELNDSLLAGEYSEFVNGTGNVLYQDPLLAPLANNGGQGGRTHALLDGSPAIDAGNDGSFMPDHDQRGAGFARVFGSGLDMGAYEQQVIEDSIFSDRFETP